ncbi:MAG: hypothetical protein A2V99_19215 [Spirochaetes bacterium RBG_16_67_19]|nr:MAG: hypothetical protein A2V99_19215 [Spirochaetes bacterium RBG_16_67_19]
MVSMVELERRISGDWIEAREAAADQYTLSKFFQLTPERLHDIARSLRLCVEEGVLEYKGALLRPVFISLEAMQYQSVSFVELELHDRPLENLLFVILLQRLVCSGVITLSKGRTVISIPTEAIGVNAILADIKQRIRLSADFQKHPAVKNIFVQVTIYQKEKKKMEDLLPTIKEDKSDTFRGNFQEVFQKIFDSIRKNYADLLAEEEARRLEQEGQSDILYRASLKSLVPLLNDQAKEVSRLRSTLAFARSDKYKTRAVLVSVFKDKAFFLALMDKENLAYARLCAELGRKSGLDCPPALGKRLGGELVRVLEKLARVEAPPQVG